MTQKLGSLLGFSAEQEKPKKVQSRVVITQAAIELFVLMSQATTHIDWLGFMYMAAFQMA